MRRRVGAKRMQPTGGSRTTTKLVGSLVLFWSTGWGMIQANRNETCNRKGKKGEGNGSEKERDVESKTLGKLSA
jgi:hypothetical protein